MLHQYFYPLVPTGHRHNFEQRIIMTIGFKPVVISSVGEYTVLEFDRALTPQEDSLLAQLCLSNPEYAPTGGTSLDVKEVGGFADPANFVAFKAAVGLPNLWPMLAETTAGSGRFDRIRLWHTGTLNNTQRNLVKQEVNKSALW